MVTTLPVQYGLLIAAALLLVGLGGLLFRRNLLFILLSLEIMLNASGLAFVVAASRWQQPDGQIMFLFILAISAAEAAVGLALILEIHRVSGTLDTDRLRRLRG
jgi:NADH-quinone oxidoreductase subunit K